MTDEDEIREKVEDSLQRLEDGFQRRWDNKPDFRSSLKGKDRDILIDLRETGTWWLEVRDGYLEEIHEGNLEDPDVSIRADAEDYLAVFDGDLGPLEAYMKQKIKVSAGLRDMMLVKSFLGS